ncbi:MAG: hypothetical protein GY796_15965, partial [Chloroflexi bacterium]|nr:hypothetical protein [Chloroflexota bacterium]
LEKLAAEYNGRFLLAKLNSDHNQQVSMQYGIRGIPAVKAFVNGRVIDEFVGAQPEPMVRQFIERVLAQQTPVPQPTAVPQTPAARLQKAKDLIRQGNGCEAVRVLSNDRNTEAGQLRPLAQFLCDGGQGNDAQIQNLIKRREYAGAMYSLMVAMNEGGNGRYSAVMQGLFTLLGDNDPTVKAYKQQLVSR